MRGKQHESIQLLSIQNACESYFMFKTKQFSF